MSKSNLEKEIEEILARLDQFVPEEGRLTRLRRRVADASRDLTRSLQGLVPRVSLGQLMIASFLLIVLAYLFRFSIPGLARYAIIAGLALFVVAFALSVRGGGRTRYERRWRGQVMNLSGPALGSRIRGWFRRPSRKDRRR